MRRAAIVTATVLTLALAACGENDDKAGTTTTTTAAAAAAGNVDRYCAIVRRLDSSGEDFFADLDKNSSAAEYEAAERRFVERYADTFNELQRVAPKQIQSDVAVLLAGQRERAGLNTTTTPQSQTTASEKRIQAFEKRNCDT